MKRNFEQSKDEAEKENQNQEMAKDLIINFL